MAKPRQERGRFILTVEDGLKGTNFRLSRVPRKSCREYKMTIKKKEKIYREERT